MPEITNGKEKIIVEKQKNQLLVTLRKLQFDADALDIIRLYVQPEDTDEGIQISYPLPAHAQSFTELLKVSHSKLERLQLAEKICRFSKKMNRYLIPFFHPDNIYLDGERLEVVHSGIEDALTPMKTDEELFFKDLKGLVLYVFHPELPFEQLVHGGFALKDKFCEAISKLETMEALENFIQNELRKQKNIIASTQRLVPKAKYLIYRIVGVVGLVLAIAAGVTTYFFWSTSQKQTAIIDAQASYITNDYAKAQAKLEKYSPESLPKSAQYILAVSGIRLTDLTDEQKEAVLNTISTKSDANTLNYWIYTGRGKFKEALNLAQNLGDDQLILLSYTNLYQVTKLDSKMDGAEKQKLLEDYTKEIDDLKEKLTGDRKSETKSSSKTTSSSSSKKK